MYHRQRLAGEVVKLQGLSRWEFRFGMNLMPLSMDKILILMQLEVSNLEFSKCQLVGSYCCRLLSDGVQ